MTNKLEDVEALARVIDEADNRWQHGIGDSGTSWEMFIAYKVLEYLK